jgi:hypothetical protein
MRRSVATALASLALLAGCGSAADEAPHIVVGEAVATLPAAAGRPGAAYFRLEANVPARLIRIASSRVGRIEMHEPGMRRVDSLALTPGEPVVFAPGGRHAMLFDVDPALRPGETLLLTLRFDGAPAIGVEAQVRRAGDVHRGH